MKKFIIMALAVCLTVVMAAPVMAVDVDFSGAYRVRGVYTSHWDLNERSASNAFMNMRFRLQTVFKATDNLSVTTRFDALDGYIWGAGNTANVGGNANNLNFDRAYMTIKTDFGKFDVGRMKGGDWGTTFIDNEGEADRIKYTKVMDNLTLLAIFEKNTELDCATKAAPTGGVVTAGGDASDLDTDTYYLAGIYKMENITSGVLFAFTNDKDTANATRHQYGAIPYFVGKFGPLGIQGELRYNWGQTEYDTLAAAGAAGGTGTTTEIDIKQLAYNLEASYNFGFATVLAGYAFVSGDHDGNADNEATAFAGVGNDWEKLFILTTNEVPALANLGGVGNLSDAGGACNPYGAKIFYGGVNVTPVENLTLGFVIGKADADEIAAGNSKDDYGIEYDFTLNWKIYDNLSYTAIAAFLSAGDLWWEAQGFATKPATFDDTYALFHQLQLSF